MNPDSEKKHERLATQATGTQHAPLYASSIP